MKKLYSLSLLMLIFIAGDTYAPQSDEVPSEVIEQVVDEVIKNSVVEPTNFDVSVYITCENESVKNLIESHIKRELRGLHDIKIKVENFGGYNISIIAIERKDMSGEKTGYISIATMFSHGFNHYIALKPYMTELQITDVLVRHKQLYYEPVLYAGIYSKENIDEFSQQTVANFDIKMLEPERKKR